MLISFCVKGLLLPICETLSLLDTEQDECKVSHEDQATHCVVQGYHTHPVDKDGEDEAKRKEDRVLAKTYDTQSCILGDLNRVEAYDGQTEAILHECHTERRKKDPKVVPYHWISRDQQVQYS